MLDNTTKVPCSMLYEANASISTDQQVDRDLPSYMRQYYENWKYHQNMKEKDSERWHAVDLLIDSDDDDDQDDVLEWMESLTFGEDDIKHHTNVEEKQQYAGIVIIDPNVPCTALQLMKFTKIKDATNIELQSAIERLTDDFKGLSISPAASQCNVPIQKRDAEGRQRRALQPKDMNKM